MPEVSYLSLRPFKHGAKRRVDEHIPVHSAHIELVDTRENKRSHSLRLQQRDYRLWSLVCSTLCTADTEARNNLATTVLRSAITKCSVNLRDARYTGIRKISRY